MTGSHRAFPGGTRGLTGVAAALCLLAAAPSLAQTGTKTDKSTPAKIYHNFCSVCHGDKGDGNSRARGSFVRPPRDFTAPESKNLSRDFMVAIVRDGKPDTAMVGWKTQLTEKEIGEVVDYVRARFMGIGEPPAAALSTAPAAAAHPSPPAGDFMAMPFPKGLKGNAAAGGEFYMKNCATCHGAKGDGQGPRAYFINPKPRNFLEASARTTLNRPLLFEVVAKGKLGTEMPAWNKVISDQEIANVAEFVFVSYIRPADAAKTAR